jgi:hypothetical protein
LLCCASAVRGFFCEASTHVAVAASNSIPAAGLSDRFRLPGASAGMHVPATSSCLRVGGRDIGVCKGVQGRWWGNGIEERMSAVA